jgi:heme/copper-type cytochrome/quinol oxidase subunit 4
MMMNLPKNVLWFEVLLYLSLILDALSVAVQDRTPTMEMTDTVVLLSAMLDVGVILLLYYFVQLAAQQRKNWPRWVLLAALVLSCVSLVAGIADKGIELDAAIEIISCALTGLGLYYSFTGDAQGWFNA